MSSEDELKSSEDPDWELETLALHLEQTASLPVISQEFREKLRDELLNQLKQSEENEEEPTAMAMGSSIIAIFSIAASVSSITQVILMVADMRSRKAKKKTLSTAEENKKGRDWDNIKEIKILMSDGSQVQIASWLHDPEKVKGFLEVFTSPAASPKPERVVFILKNGSRLPVTISNQPESKQNLDALIQYLKMNN